MNIYCIIIYTDTHLRCLWYSLSIIRIRRRFDYFAFEQRAALVSFIVVIAIFLYRIILYSTYVRKTYLRHIHIHRFSSSSHMLTRKHAFSAHKTRCQESRRHSTRDDLFAIYV